MIVKIERSKKDPRQARAVDCAGNVYYLRLRDYFDPETSYIGAGCLEYLETSEGPFTQATWKLVLKDELMAAYRSLFWRMPPIQEQEALYDTPALGPAAE